MCKRNDDNSLEICEPCERTIGRNFVLGSWVNIVDGKPDGEPINSLAIKSGEFSKRAGIRINFCPFTGENIERKS